MTAPTQRAQVFDAVIAAISARNDVVDLLSARAT